MSGETFTFWSEPVSMVETPIARFRVRLALFSTLITCACGACVGAGCAVGSATGAVCFNSRLFTYGRLGHRCSGSEWQWLYLSQVMKCSLQSGSAVSRSLGDGKAVLVEKVEPRSTEIPQLRELTVRERIRYEKSPTFIHHGVSSEDIPLAELPIFSLYTRGK